MRTLAQELRAGFWVWICCCVTLGKSAILSALQVPYFQNRNNKATCLPQLRAWCSTVLQGRVRRAQPRTANCCRGRFLDCLNPPLLNKPRPGFAGRIHELICIKQALQTGTCCAPTKGREERSEDGEQQTWETRRDPETMTGQGAQGKEPKREPGEQCLKAPTPLPHMETSVNLWSEPPSQPGCWVISEWRSGPGNGILVCKGLT